MSRVSDRFGTPLYAKDQVNPRLATTVYDLARSSNLPVSLVILTSREQEAEDEESSEGLMNMAIHHLRQVGLRDDQIRSNKIDVSDVSYAVERLSAEDDLVILAESSTTDRDSFFSTIHEDIEKSVTCPILVVLRENEEDSEDFEEQV